MPHLFSYTECEAPGPFNAKAGFKIKSLSSLGSVPASSELERLLNITIANFPRFDAPKVDAYATREDFLSLPKVWSFLPVVEGHVAFIRLATSGTKMGRPGNPFHQALVTKFRDIQVLIDQAASLGLDNLTPADLYFWDWHNPRGDAEVELATYADGTMPIPKLSELELSEYWERVFGNPTGLMAAKQFESKFLTNGSRKLPVSEQDYFSLLTLLFRLVPLEYSWSIPFSNQVETRLPKDFDPQQYPTLSRSDDSVLDLAEQSVFWAELLEEIVENGLQIEVIRILQKLGKLFQFSLQTHRQALVFMPLAVLVMEDQYGILDGQGLRNAAWQIIQDLGIRMEYRSADAKDQFYDSYISKLDLKKIPPAAEIWLTTTEVRK